MRRLLGAALLAFIAQASSVQAAYQLVWQDEFDGTQLDLAKWTPQIGNGCPDLCGWGNSELQYYRAENATVAGGFLTITAKEESFGGMDYTSARLRTINLGDWTHGRFEMRAKMPIGQGLWPAFWMLPTDNIYGGWAASGEIDIVEYLGHDPDHILGTIHYGGEFPLNAYSGGAYTLPSGTFHDDFHEFAIEWDESVMRWYVDGILYSTKNSWWSAGGPYPAPFDQPFHLLLNVAVGGNLPGPPDGTTMFPQEMVVDWVRVWQEPGPDLVACTTLFDDMEHGNPFGNNWFSFGGTVGGGGIDANFTSVPPVDGGGVSLESGWGSGGTPGFFGGFGRGNPMDLTDATHFTFWIEPDAGQDYTLEINLADDDDGDDGIPGTPDGADDEFQYDFHVSQSGPGAIAGGGWQYVSIPIADFFDDNSYHFGGNGVFDPTSVGAGGNGRLITVVMTVIGNSGSDVTFRTDRWAFTEQTGELSGRVWDDANGDGFEDGGEPGLDGVTVELYDTRRAMVLATNVTAGGGDYAFTSQYGGELEVRVSPATLPAGFVPTHDPDGTATADVYAVSVVCFQTVANGDFGYRSDGTSAPAPDLRSGGGLRNTPNPFRPRTEIRFDLDRETRVDLIVHDVTGRRVKRLLGGTIPAGAHRVEWNGIDEEGRPVSPGVYFYSLQTAEGRTVGKMTRLR